MDIINKNYNMHKTLLTILSTTLLLSSILIGCVSVKGHLKYQNRSNNDLPDDAFAFVAVKQIIAPGKCLPSERFEECNSIIHQFPPQIKGGSGSGLLVWAKKRPVFLTAAHVCTDEFPDEVDIEGIRFSVEKSQEIKVLSASGNYMNTEIIHIDQKTDLCALDVPTMEVPPVKISHRPPKVGDKVYAISAPYGIHKPTMTLVFSGYYSGHTKKWNFYTIPTRPGSSGSVVLNENYRAVGMLNAAFLDIEHVGLGAGWKEIIEFIGNIPE